ncbi:hypoxanthine phosphoribosyltransferase [Candidatus Nanosynbacter lyticus]|uniref:hypoxanthine phosphoribosyltransferase n=1 Tax=Candidatus Nanosynbacter lyticus TaxID=2093824 RepID=UPI002556159F|nr:hypoxanthine phosphoribosyltransferase [Candidatus Nanosynbacter lyticus]WLD46616.1 hypoxanthine phosphoribosyltransferase [Candidatus Nanosynbacter lyticus]
MNQDIATILVTTEQINDAVARLGQELTAEYRDKNPLVIGVLRGVAPFMIDLVRAMDCYLEIDFIDVSSYGDATESSGAVTVLKDIDSDVTGRHVLLVEDIVDTGRTLEKLLELFAGRGAASVKVCSLLDKPERRIVNVTADYIGLSVPNEFVVGYGLDFRQQYRNLPYIGVLKPEIYQN